MKKQLLLTLLSLMAIYTQTARAAEIQDTLSTEQKVRKNTLEIGNLKLQLGKLGELKISGYVQGQWQWAEEKGVAAFGDGGSFGADINNRFMLRRGRVKFTWTKGIVSAVVQPDLTEKGVSLKDFYIDVTSRNKAFGGRLGQFDRPFGYEITTSSSLRESPERSRVFLSLFPGEREIGAMFTMTGAKGWLSQFTLNAGLFNGNGVGVETDSRKDFIGRLSWLKKWNNTVLGSAVSYYYGGVKNPVGENYHYIKNEGFRQTTTTEGRYALRQYFGVAAQFMQHWAAGTTQLRSEFVWGNQPGTLKNNNNPSGTSFGAGSAPLYLRRFAGGYVMLVQNIVTTKHSVVLKYDYYDPNTRVAGNEIGKLSGTGAADVAYSTFGFGYLYQPLDYLRLTAYYDIVNNEKSSNLSGYADRIKQNVFTLRVQFKF